MAKDVKDVLTKAHAHRLRDSLLEMELQVADPIGSGVARHLPTTAASSSSSLPAAQTSEKIDWLSYDSMLHDSGPEGRWKEVFERLYAWDTGGPKHSHKGHPPAPLAAVRRWHRTGHCNWQLELDRSAPAVQLGRCGGSDGMGSVVTQPLPAQAAPAQQPAPDRKDIQSKLNQTNEAFKHLPDTLEFDTIRMQIEA